ADDGRGPAAARVDRDRRPVRPGRHRVRAHRGLAWLDAGQRLPDRRLRLRDGREPDRSGLDGAAGRPARADPRRPARATPPDPLLGRRGARGDRRATPGAGVPDAHLPRYGPRADGRQAPVERGALVRRAQDRADRPGVRPRPGGPLVSRTGLILLLALVGLVLAG